MNYKPSQASRVSESPAHGKRSVDVGITNARRSNAVEIQSNRKGTPLNVDNVSPLLLKQQQVEKDEMEDELRLERDEEDEKLQKVSK